MDGQRDLRRRNGEARGFLPPTGAPPARWRRVLDRILGGCDDIDRDGLLAARTLLIARRRPTRARTDAPTGPERDEAHR